MPHHLLTDLPKQVPVSEYATAVDALKEHLSRQPGFVSFYSIGGVSAPGISDLDVIVVWEEGGLHDADFRPSGTAYGGYLFIHSLYATTPGLFREALRYTCYEPSRLLAGQDLHTSVGPSLPDPVVRRQIAIEYLLRLFVGLHLQHLQRMLRVRSILLNANGISSDLNVLFPGNGEAARLLQELSRLRKDWFGRQEPPVDAFRAWFREFYPWIGSMLSDLLDEQALYLPEQRMYRLGRNIRLEHSDKTVYPPHAIRLPFLRPIVGRRYPNLLNRINRHVFRIPYTTDHLPEQVRAYFDFTRRHRDYNRMYLPAYLPLTGSLQLT